MRISLNIIIYTLLFSITSSCTQFQHITRYNQRVPASTFVNNCRHLLFALSNETDNKITNLSSWKDILDFKDVYQDEFGANYIVTKSLKSSYLSKDLELISFFKNVKINQSLDKVFIEAIKNKISSFTNLDQFIVFFKLLDQSGISIELQKKIIKKSDLKKYNLINNLYNYNSIEEVLISNLLNKSKKVKSPDDFLDLTNLLTPAPFDLKKIHAILSQSPIYKNLRVEYPHLFDEWSNVLEIRDINSYKDIYLNFVQGLRVEMGIINDELVTSINGPYAFYKLIDSKKHNTKLIESIYAKRIGYTKQMLGDSYRKYSLTSYDKEVSVFNINNQCGWGSCWLNTSNSQAESEIFNSIGEKIPLSVDYQYRQYIINQIIGEYNIRSTQKIEEGGYETIFYKIAATYGIMPKTSWKPKVPFHNIHAARKFKSKVRDIRREIYFQEKNKDKAKEIFEKKVTELADNIFGKVPENFDYMGNSYTPLEFFKKMLPGEEQYIETRSIPNGQFTFQDATRSSFYTKIKGKFKEIFHLTPNKEISYLELENIIRQSIDNNIPVKSGIIWGNKNISGFKFIDNSTGVINAKERYTHLQKNSSHAILIVGYELDRNNRITRLKIQNSYGQVRGDNGFYHMDIKYFHHYLKRIIITEV